MKIIKSQKNSIFSNHAVGVIESNQERSQIHRVVLFVYKATSSCVVNDRAESCSVLATAGLELSYYSFYAEILKESL